VADGGGTAGSAEEASSLESTLHQFLYAVTGPAAPGLVGLAALGDWALAPGEAFDPVVLEGALADLMAGLANLRQDLLDSLANLGWYPWLVALAAVALTIAEYQRRQRQITAEGHGSLTPGWTIP
jgi:hypothetical protein